MSHAFGSIARNRELVWEMTLRELKGINQGAVLGYVWLVISPLVQALAYVTIVSFVFRSRLSSSSGTFDYALYVLSGMVPWQIVTKSLQEAPSVIRQQMDLVKQVIYPIETLPLTGILAGSVGSAITLVVFLGLTLAAGGVHWTYVLLPVPLLLLMMFLLGSAWILSIAGVLVKDLKEIVSVSLALLVYVSPVIARPEVVGEKVWRLIQLNPLTHVVIPFRDVFYGQFHPMSWIIFVGMSVGAFVFGSWVINRTKLLINEYI